ncbi:MULTISPECIES: Hsp70 family protein [unclassified Modestobacter]|uniref:Hsp70 family protein n=1 Tax=unclassified Modestobacter TaxID=2643866 RepID=UPI0022AB0DE2|nr:MULTISPECIES: Hsp70 family protein [unclassified Modestobacter]MCZ2826063.1 Hsp70 family protein [Modestobacter sp. VKM Ac-2981]MCZ2852872.1 Hsp70 family protein [Modestobacter sp. VKM Ac-2982]
MIPIGIDLGTTYSVIGHVRDDGAIDVIRNDEGELLTPSAVFFDDDGSVVVGREAKNGAPIYPDRTALAIKRQMGRDHHLVFGEHSYRPEGVSAIILRALVAAASEHLGVPPEQIAAVISVPAYFGVAEREATAAAAQIAGLQCLDLVAEPVAAALAYGISSGETGTVLVYDLGGGTFDATIVQVTDTGPTVVAVDGSEALGGLNFDDRLTDLLLERYVLASSDEEAADDEDFVARLAGEAEHVKKALTQKSTASAKASRNGSRSMITVTREEFDKACSDLLDETLTVAERAIAAAVRAGAPRPSRVVLVGGSTRMPMIAEGLARRFGLPVQVSDPDLAVGKGAAVHARSLSGRPLQLASGAVVPESARRLQASRPISSVVPRALGIKILDSNDPSGERIIVEHLIPANAPLPVPGVQATFATIMPDQDRVRVELMEQAGAVASPEAAYNRRVLDGEIVDIPAGLPAGSQIDITLSVGLDGRLRCAATEPRSGRTLLLESYVEGVSDSSDVETQRAVVSGLRLAR